MLIELLIYTLIIIISFLTLLYLKKVLEHRYIIPLLFSEIREKYTENGEVVNRLLKNVFTATADMFEIRIELATNEWHKPSRALITIRNQKGAVPNPIHITNGHPESSSYIEIKQALKNITLICESPCSRQQLQKMMTPGLLDLLMETLMVECRPGSPSIFHIRAEKDTLNIEFSSLPMSSRYMQLLLVCACGLSRELCRTPYIPDKEKSKSLLSSGDQKKYLQQSLYFLIVFSVILIILISFFVYKKKTISAMTESFSGTVILKKIVNENEYYIFVPQKAKISKEDFDTINEGDRVEKVKGQEKIHISKEAPADKEEFLDLLQDN